MGRRQRENCALALQSVADVPDGYGGLKHGTAANVITNYSAFWWNPSVYQHQRNMALYGLTEAGRYIMVEGNYNAAIVVGLEFSLDADVAGQRWGIVGKTHIQGRRTAFIQTVFVAELKE